MLKKLPVFLVVVFAGFAVIMVLNQLLFGGDRKTSLVPSDEQAVAPTDTIVVAPTNGTSEPVPSSAMPVPGSDVPEMIVVSGVSAVVTYTSSGFSPQELGPIGVGDTVVFKNESSRSVWPASAMHPTHKVYPNSDIAKCGTSEEPKIFDSCRGIEPGGEWSFKFNEVGSWKYHDHLNASRTGTIVVR